MPLGLGGVHAGDIELVSATPAEFAWQMEHIARHFEPVTLTQVAEALDGIRALPERAVAVTFDDGFCDLHQYAWPILAKARMPASVFVSTDYVDSGEPFWFDLVAWLLSHVPPGAVRLPGVAHGLPAEASEAARRHATVVTLKWLKSIAEHQRRAFVERLCADFAAVAESAEAVLGRALNWEELREMAGEGLEVGSHTAGHRCLTQLSPDELRHELVWSKARIEDELRRPVISLAYPFGGRAAFNDVVARAAHDAGYRVALSYMPGVNALDAADRFGLLRQHVERDTTRAYFQALVTLPELFD